MNTWQWSGVPGMDLHDALRAACAMMAPQSYLEIGVDGGGSLSTVLSSSRPSRIALCDIWNPDYCNHGLTGHEHLIPVLRHFGVTAEFLDGDSKALVPQLTGSFDLITVDGDHTAEGAWSDLANAWPLLRTGGILVFDDVGHPNYPHLPQVLFRFLVDHPDAMLIPEAGATFRNAALLTKVSAGEWLELGCGARPTPGYIHHDRWQHAAHVDVAFDLECLPWPLADSSLDRILALDVFEHLRLEVQQWLDECWRVLKPGGLLEIRLPAWNNPYAFCDPTHRRVFHHESLLYWCPDAPGSVFANFGRYYFGPGYNKWWQQESVIEDLPDAPHRDLRWRLRKLSDRGPDGRPLA